MPGITISKKDSLMSSDMEEFITDTIIIAKVKNEGERHADSKMAKAINKKLDEHFGGSWLVFISKCETAPCWVSSGIPWNGTYIEIEHGAYNFVIFRK